MGSRDYRHREAKKPKKDAKKAIFPSILSPEPVVEVEVIKKGKKKRGEEEEESEQSEQ
jgi:hypothetical protein